MREKANGIEIFNINGDKVLDIFFDSGHMYFAAGSLPIVLKNITQNEIQQIGEFFYYHGNDPTKAAYRIEFPDLSIRIDGTLVYLIQEKISLVPESVTPSELKKAGIWLKKKAKSL